MTDDSKFRRGATHGAQWFREVVKEMTASGASAADIDDRLGNLNQVLLDWREDHAKGAKHLSRGTIELEIEEQVPDLKTPIICYCGGGSRSALVAESLQKMGYENVRSLAGGFRAWKEGGLPGVKE